MTVISNIFGSWRRQQRMPALARVLRAAGHRLLPAFAPSIHRSDRGTLACLGEAR
jgi:hypothetical protein